jgi:hypothetical protein
MWLQDMLFYMCGRFFLQECLLLEGRDGQTWKNHVHNCASCHLPNVDGQIDPSLVVVLVSLWSTLCGQASRATTMLICDKCFWSWYMGCLMPPMKEMSIGKWFCPHAPNRPRFLGSHCRISLRFSSMVIYIWLGIWRITTRWLLMGLTFALGLVILLL